MTTSSEHSPEGTPILVTGAAGLIGIRLVRALAGEFPVAAFDVVEPDEEIPNTDWIHCDLTDDAAVRDSLTQLRERHGNHLASVIHLAAYYDFSGEPSPLYQDLTVRGTGRLLQGLQSFDVDQFVFSSTLLVMQATSPGQLLTEDSPVNAEWDYPESKLATERLISESRKSIPSIVLRIAGAYDEDCHSIPIAQQMRRIFEEEVQSHFFPGNLDHGQSFVHLDDVVACIYRVIQRRHDLESEELFLVGEPDVVSYGELQQMIGEILHGTAWSTVEIPKSAAKVGAWAEEKVGHDTFIKPWMIDLADAHYPIDVSRARNRLGWLPKHCLRDTVPEMARRLREDPARWYRANKLELPEWLSK